MSWVRVGDEEIIYIIFWLLLLVLTLTEFMMIMMISLQSIKAFYNYLAFLFWLFDILLALGTSVNISIAVAWYLIPLLSVFECLSLKRLFNLLLCTSFPQFALHSSIPQLDNPTRHLTHLS